MKPRRSTTPVSGPRQTDECNTKSARSLRCTLRYTAAGTGPTGIFYLGSSAVGQCYRLTKYPSVDLDSQYVPVQQHAFFANHRRTVKVF
jgi:hypothetical protein